LKILLAIILTISLSISVFSESKVIHVFVALCDNDNQGIVPVPKKLGNGEDPDNNLYWGAMYGVKTHFKKSKNWKLVETKKDHTDKVLERVIFKHNTEDVYLIADAYKGVEIKQTILDFLSASAGKELRTDLAVYIGHNGLMDFKIDKSSVFKGDKRDSKNPKSIVLACKSKQYFRSLLSSLKSEPLLLTTGFMAPEAYTLDAALYGYLSGKNKKAIQELAAQAYNKYQKCGIKGARRLFDKSK